MPFGVPENISAGGPAGFGSRQAEPVAMLPSGPGDLPLPPIPFPALRVRVESMSQDTFRVLLQYIYTGQIILSEQQLTDVEMYWNDNAEGYQLSQGGTQSGQRFTEGGVATCSGGNGAERDREESHPKAPTILPPLEPLWPSPLPSKGHGREAKDGSESHQTAFTAPLYATWDRSYDDSPAMISTSAPVYASTPAPSLSSWTPCSRWSPHLLYRDNIHRIHDSGPNQTPPQPKAQSQGQGQQQQQHPGVHQPHRKKERHSTCSWENLLLAATECELPDLQELAMTANQYRCQMMAIHASTDSNNNNNSCDDGLPKVAQTGFDETTLDIQLALSEHVLRLFLNLYSSPLLRESSEGSLAVTKEQDTEGPMSVDEKHISMSHKVPHRKRESVHIKKSGFETQYEAGEQSSRSDDGSSNGTGGSVEPVDSDMAEEDERKEEQEQESAASVEFENLLGEPECEEALTELCDEIQYWFSRMREIT
ncbi:hypothetical protein BGZ58_009939 [Dissophora ornata]|nr:hypothetical protein BGZ58_009939 [Dissophora ornata]